MGLIKLTVAFGGAKHEIEHLSPGLRVSELKAQLEPLTGLPPPHMRLIVKGKEAPDHSSLADLNVAHGAKLMLLRNAGGSSATSRPAPPHAPPSSLPPSLAPPDPPVAKEQKQTPIVYGEGSVQLSVVQGRQQHALLCEEATTVTELKGLLHSSCGVHPSQQRLLFKGKEIRAAQTVAELGLAGGGKLMLLFRERHHLEAEGKEAVRAGGEELSSLEQQWSSLQRKVSARRAVDVACSMRGSIVLHTPTLA
ncbi:MAG: hypothetical protein SGPRY_000788 [Prymnesium sp.]